MEREGSSFFFDCFVIYASDGAVIGRVRLMRPADEEPERKTPAGEFMQRVHGGCAAFADGPLRRLLEEEYASSSDPMKRLRFPAVTYTLRFCTRRGGEYVSVLASVSLCRQGRPLARGQTGVIFTQTGAVPPSAVGIGRRRLRGGGVPAVSADGGFCIVYPDGTERPAGRRPVRGADEER